MTNVELRNSFYFRKTERSETILRNSAVRYSLFCGSLFRPREFSYKRLKLPRRNILNRFHPRGFLL